MKAFQLWSRFLYIVQFPMIGLLSVMLVFLPGGVDAGGWVTVIVFYMMGPFVVLLAVIAVMTTIRAVAKRAALIAPGHRVPADGLLSVRVRLLRGRPRIRRFEELRLDAPASRPVRGGIDLARRRLLQGGRVPRRRGRYRRLRGDDHRREGALHLEERPGFRRSANPPSPPAPRRTQAPTRPERRSAGPQMRRTRRRGGRGLGRVSRWGTPRAPGTPHDRGLHTKAGSGILGA
ncbi:hypothetical protein HMPREF0043_01510 [Actinobaculum sp. oral taxon 183 str. F0552]|nr:hypothetical protein HMPREF0043_01510 [Actinobaculum sp. oral taxon 183 str. F0552]